MIDENLFFELSHMGWRLYCYLAIRGTPLMMGYDDIRLATGIGKGEITKCKNELVEKNILRFKRGVYKHTVSRWDLS